MTLKNGLNTIISYYRSGRPALTARLGFYQCPAPFGRTALQNAAPTPDKPLLPKL